MAFEVAEAIVLVLESYAAAGLVFAILFLPRVVARLDPGVAAASATLRLMLVPGVVALWPLFAWRWIKGAHAPVENNPHRTRARQDSGATVRGQLQEASR